MKNSRLLKNGTALMIFHLAKIAFPFITLPYLTRVLSTDAYGITAYTKTIMNYMQIFVDFGFVLSATKDIVNVRKNSKKLEKVIGETMTARLLLGLAGFAIVLALSLALPLLRENLLFSLLSYVTVFLSIFLLDFLFRGLEIMHIITIRFVLMKTISTLLTFLLVKSDSDLLLIPLLDIFSSLLAIALAFLEMKKLNLKFRLSKLKPAYIKIKESFIFFLSTAASTSLNALSTIIIGIYSSPTDVAYWSLAMQIIGTITACYNPISDSLYPEMIKTKDFRLIKNSLKIFLPLILLGCIFSYFIAPTAFNILGGEDYAPAVPIFRLLIPVLLLSFLSIMYGWPSLGAIEKNNLVTIATIVSVALNILSLIVLAKTDNFTLKNIAIARVLTEALLFGLRFFFVQKNLSLFKTSEKLAKTPK